MPNPGSRLSNVSWAGETPKLILSDENVDVLSAITEAEISQEQKSELEDICNHYIHSRRAELASMPRSALRQRLQSFKEATKNLPWHGYDDAGLELISMIEEHLDQYVVELTGVAHFGWDDEQRCWLPKKQSERQSREGISVDMDFFAKVISKLTFALADTEQNIVEQEKSGDKGFFPGDALKVWILEVRDWAKRHGFRYGPTTGSGAPSAFSKFAYYLHGLLPQDFREKQMLSEKAMAARIKRTRQNRGR